MDTEWKNVINNMSEFIRKIREYVCGTVLIVSGIWIQGYIYFDYYCLYNYLGGDALFWWCLSNAVLMIGVFLIMKKYVTVNYNEWQPDETPIYQEWKDEVIRQEKKLFVIFTVIIFLSLWTDRALYSTFVITTMGLLQFIFVQIYFLRFMGRKLSVFMEQMDEINKQKLETALEIERQSLEKVSKSDQLRLDLITNVSHDLKTPITSMVGYLELMKKEELSDVVRDYLDVIVDKTDKLKEMIESLFSLAKVSSGNIELHKEKFGFNRLIEQIMGGMKDRIDESELQFVTKLTKEDTEIYSDNMYCYRICQNLFENALKYAAKGTRVFVKTYIGENDTVCLEMTNTAGYPMDFEKEEILEKFARGDKARSTDGNGLGLAIVSSYAKALGGEFDIQIDCDQFKAYVILQKN